MGVRKKNRRRIEVSGRSFVWYVCDDPDSLDLVLHVISEDKHFLVTYHLAQGGDPHLNVIGPDFAGVPNAGGIRRFRCPVWEVGGLVTPRGVRCLIEWCLSADKALVEVDWRNRPAPSSA